MNMSAMITSAAQPYWLSGPCEVFLLAKKKKQSFTSFWQPTRLITYVKSPNHVQYFEN